MLVLMSRLLKQAEKTVSQGLKGNECFAYCCGTLLFKQNSPHYFASAF